MVKTLIGRIKWTLSINRTRPEMMGQMRPIAIVLEVVALMIERIQMVTWSHQFFTSMSWESDKNTGVWKFGWVLSSWKQSHDMKVSTLNDS